MEKTKIIVSVIRFWSTALKNDTKSYLNSQKYKQTQTKYLQKHK